METTVTPKPEPSTSEMMTAFMGMLNDSSLKTENPGLAAYVSVIMKLLTEPKNESKPTVKPQVSPAPTPTFRQVPVDTSAPAEPAKTDIGAVIAFRNRIRDIVNIVISDEKERVRIVGVLTQVLSVRNEKFDGFESNDEAKFLLNFLLPTVSHSQRVKLGALLRAPLM